MRIGVGVRVRVRVRERGETWTRVGSGTGGEREESTYSWPKRSIMASQLGLKYQGSIMIMAG